MRIELATQWLRKYAPLTIRLTETLFALEISAIYTMPPSTSKYGRLHVTCHCQLTFNIQHNDNSDIDNHHRHFRNNNGNNIASNGDDNNNNNDQRPHLTATGGSRCEPWYVFLCFRWVFFFPSFFFDTNHCFFVCIVCNIRNTRQGREKKYGNDGKAQTTCPASFGP